MRPRSTLSWYASIIYVCVCFASEEESPAGMREQVSSQLDNVMS
jgi:hypothetical protein